MPCTVDCSWVGDWRASSAVEISPLRSSRCCGSFSANPKHPSFQHDDPGHWSGRGRAVAGTWYYAGLNASYCRSAWLFCSSTSARRFMLRSCTGRACGALRASNRTPPMRKNKRSRHPRLGLISRCGLGSESVRTKELWLRDWVLRWPSSQFAGCDLTCPSLMEATKSLLTGEQVESLEQQCQVSRGTSASLGIETVSFVD